MNAVPILDPGGAELELRVCGGPLRCHLLVTFRAGGCIDNVELASSLHCSFREIPNQIRGNSRPNTEAGRDPN